MATDLIGPAMAAFLAEAQTLLVPAVGRAALYPGLEVAWDDCCDGQLWVRLVNMQPGAPAQPGQPCGVVLWNVTFGMGVLRCASPLYDDGRAPDASALTADNLQMTADSAALQQAIQCAIAPAVERLTLNRWDPQGPQGGCVGGEWLFTVKLTNCPCS